MNIAKKIKVNRRSSNNLLRWKAQLESENPTSFFLGVEESGDVYILDVRKAGFFYSKQIPTSILEIVSGPGFSHYYAVRSPIAPKSPDYHWNRVFHKDDLKRAEALASKLSD